MLLMWLFRTLASNAQSEVRIGGILGMIFPKLKTPRRKRQS